MFTAYPVVHSGRTAMRHHRLFTVELRKEKACKIVESMIESGQPFCVKSVQTALGHGSEDHVSFMAAHFAVQLVKYEIDRTFLALRFGAPHWWNAAA
jgi:hypothetical protein